MSRLTFDRRIDAPADVVWDVVSDPDIYAEAAPNLDSVEVLEGEGVGMVRRCVDTNGNEWTERCTEWVDESGYAVSVDVADSDFHRRLFHRFEGEWTLSETAEGVVVSMAFEFEPRFGPFGRLLSRYFAYRAPSLVEAIFDCWEAEIGARVGPADSTGDRPVPGPDDGTDGRS